MNLWSDELQVYIFRVQARAIHGWNQGGEENFRQKFSCWVIYDSSRAVPGTKEVLYGGQTVETHFKFQEINYALPGILNDFVKGKVHGVKGIDLEGNKLTIFMDPIDSFGE